MATRLARTSRTPADAISGRRLWARLCARWPPLSKQGKMLVIFFFDPPGNELTPRRALTRTDATPDTRLQGAVAVKCPRTPTSGPRQAVTRIENRVCPLGSERTCGPRFWRKRNLALWAGVSCFPVTIVPNRPGFRRPVESANPAKPPTTHLWQTPYSRHLQSG